MYRHRDACTTSSASSYSYLTETTLNPSQPRAINIVDHMVLSCCLSGPLKFGAWKTLQSRIQLSSRLARCSQWLKVDSDDESEQYRDDYGNQDGSVSWFGDYHYGEWAVP